MSFSAFIAGSGGIGVAVAVLLRECWAEEVDVLMGDISQSALDKAKEQLLLAGDAQGAIDLLDMSQSDWEQSLKEQDILLDCLPGRFAPKMAKIALELGMHYVNLTEYVQETKEIKKLAEGAQTGFALQCGLAPGFVNVLGVELFQQFCADYGVEKVDQLEMKVGALSEHASSPHFYAFTWSPIGVATEYVKAAEVVENHQLNLQPALSGRREIIIDGFRLEEDFTSGGAADLPEALKDRVKNLHYKTIRYCGHYGWVEQILSEAPPFENNDGQDRIDHLEREMMEQIPSVEDDLVVIFAAVEGKDKDGRLRRLEKSFWVRPMLVGELPLRAIQSTTAAGMAEAARILLITNHQGVLLQSQIDPTSYMSGPFVSSIYDTMF